MVGSRDDGVQWVSVLGAHTDNHVPQLRRLRAAPPPTLERVRWGRRRTTRTLLSRIDHIVIGVRDLDVAATRMWRHHGLEAQPGGTHSGAGTANMLVPLGNDQFFELLAVVDPTSPHPSSTGCRHSSSTAIV
jgi:hypothetical protein